ncbi:MAG: maleylpyruvate isomerase family mycothiol-dependent enzyme [Saccharothrix sp.]|nr:maleylpyruvate isomerase family mycothiol-dependent enzyme [Saccharothrix sp.]
MPVYDMLVDERLRMADLLEGLSAEQTRTPSLCAGWTVHDVGAHLVTYLRFGQAKLYWAIATTAANFDEYNRRLTAREARLSTVEVAGRLRRWAGSRTTIPRAGFEPILADIVLHDLDVRMPLGIERTIPEDRLHVVFQHLAERPSPGFSMGSRLHGLRLEAVDTGWEHGRGPAVRGEAEPLVLAMSGRPEGFDRLEGDGLALLRERVAEAPPRGAGERMKAVVRQALNLH